MSPDDSECQKVRLAYPRRRAQDSVGQIVEVVMTSFQKVRTLLLGIFIAVAFAPDLASDKAAADASAAGGSDANTREPAVEWICANAIRLKTVEAGHGFDDMKPLKKVVGEARIVSLGEATHGSREFFQLKHRMVEFLATQMGFTIFTIEANMPESYKLNDYVLHGTGDPKERLREMYFWTWQTEEVLGMIEWMREFNRSGKGHIEFTGFDMQTPTVAAEIVRKYVAEHDGPYLATLDPVWQQVAKSRPSGGSSFGVGTATFPIQIAAGHTITYSGYIKTENITRGYAGLWWRIDGEQNDTGYPKILGFDNMNDRGPHGTTGWTKYEIKMAVPAEARNINFGVLHPGDGSAWFDSLQIAIDGVPYTDKSRFDLDFESETPHGFYTGGQGYKVAIDKEVAHTGKQSLRSTSVADNSENVEAAPNAVATSCKAIVRELEDLRSGVNGDSEKLKELEWVIQNAGIVLQYAQLNAGQKSRDESMAENIKWIADQNPEAKIIVWAHNGHISHGGVPSYAPMGSYLRQMFGSQYLNFGFVFNEGSFQAVEMGKGLRDFTVGPAPEGSLDATLASTGVPVFALDLRTVPKQGPAADWLKASHQTRSIGAVFSDHEANSYFINAVAPDMFNALLFVGKTNAAHKIVRPEANPAK